MNGAHFHLIVNHISLFTSFFGLIALIWFFARKSPEMLVAACLLFVVTGAGAFLADESGEKAEHIVKELQLPGVEKAMIHTHEEAADYAVINSYILAGLGVLILYFSKKHPNWVKRTTWLALLFALMASTSMARTAYLGGLIRHTEIR